MKRVFKQNSGSGNIYEYQERQCNFLILECLSILAALCRKSHKIRIYAIDIHKIIHKNEINDYSPAFRTQSYRLIFAIRGKAKIAENV